MGFLSSDNSAELQDAMMNQQIQENEAELEQKRDALYQQRLEIIRGQGGQSWSPAINSPNDRVRDRENAKREQALDEFGRSKGIFGEAVRKARRRQGIK